MGDRRCCCISCFLGSDNFNDRTNGPVPASDPKWKVISGAWEFDVDPGPPPEGNVVSTTKGVLATRICHPAKYIHGSYLAEMDLLSFASTENKWAVTVGDPTNPFYYVTVEWDAVTSAAVVTIYSGSEAPANILEQHTYSGISNVEGLVSSLKICYAPSLVFSVGLAQNIPTMDICDDNVGNHCYSHAGTSVGGFAFAEGRFDNWTYEAHWLDDPECDPCPCFCLKSRADDDYSCYPKILRVTFVSVGAELATLPDVLLYQQNPAGTHWPEKYYWYSPVQNCGSPVYAEWALRFECPGVPIAGVTRLGSITLLDGTFADTGQIVFSWADGESAAGGESIVADSTCDPLSLTFPTLKVNCAYPSPSCFDPALMESPYCSNLAGLCYAECPDIRFVPMLVVPP